jgi:uncharacterized protein YecA (UPF0149 family)
MQSYRFSSDELGGDDLVPCVQVPGSRDSITRGGEAFSFEVVDGGRRFAIDDLSCANPDCSCRKASCPCGSDKKYTRCCGR